MSRPEWDEYFLEISVAVSRRADCRRARHGAVIVKHNRIISTGYNASPAGGPSCLAGECPRGLLTYSQKPSLSGYDDCVSLHAEANALLYASRDECEGATIYITGQPCSWCARLISGSGITRTVFPTPN